MRELIELIELKIVSNEFAPAFGGDFFSGFTVHQRLFLFLRLQLRTSVSKLRSFIQGIYTLNWSNTRFLLNRNKMFQTTFIIDYLFIATKLIVQNNPLRFIL